MAAVAAATVRRMRGLPFSGLSLLAALMYGSPVVAAEPVVYGMRVSAFGIYREKLDRLEPSAKTAMGYLRIVTERELVQQTETVCARLGVTFGFDFRIEGGPAGVPLSILAVTRFPPPGMVNGKGERFQQNEYDGRVVVGAPSSRSFTFEEPWEMVPGIWTFEFHHHGRMVGEKSFEVVTACPVS